MLIAALWPLAIAVANGGWQGAPLALRFGPEALDANPGILAVASDAEGWVYGANFEGVLRFDGQRWQRIELPADGIARALATGEEGRVYVGGADSFGVLEPDATGRLIYRDLRDAFELQGSARAVGTVWQVLGLPEGIYFHTDTGLFLLAADGRHRSWPLPENLRSYYIGRDQLYARIAGRGLVSIRDGEPVDLPGGDVFANQVLAGMVVSRGGLVLVAGNGLYTLESGRIGRLAPPPWRQDHAADLPYEAIGLSDHSILVGTLAGDLYRFDEQGALLGRVDLDGGAIRALTQDRDGGVWVGTDHGMQRLSVQMGWSFLDSRHGVQGLLYDMIWHDDALWLTGSRGLARLRPDGDGELVAHWLDQVEMEAFDLHAEGRHLLVAHRDGLLQLTGESQWRELLDRKELISDLLPVSGRGADRIWAIGEHSLIVLAAGPDGWSVRARHDLDGLSLWGAEEEQPGWLWLGDARGAPQRWHLDVDTGALLERRVMGEEVGLALSAAHGSAIKRLDGEILAVSDRTVFRWNGEGWRPGPSEPFARFARPMYVQFEEADDGLYGYGTEAVWHRPIGQPQWQPLAFDVPQARGVGTVRYGSDGKLRIATWLGLLQRESPGQVSPLPPLRLRLFAASLLPTREGGAEIPLPLASSAPAPQPIPLGGTLSVQFGLLGVDPGQEFRYRITHNGADAGWSPWTGDRDLQLRAARAGHYQVEFEGRVRSGRGIEPLSLYFEAPTPWYQRAWARSLGLVLGAGLLVLALMAIIAWRTRRLAQVNQTLEQGIAERTLALEAANRKLADLATEDALTGVLNRRALDQGIQREWVRCHDQRQPMAVLMIDVDHFKRYNDEHGHLEGDRMLRQIAAMLQSGHDPEREMLARYGGEEFVLILPGTALDEAMRRAEQIRAGFAEAQQPITLSIGVAAQVPQASVTAIDLLCKADTALYQAKRAGRNRVASG